ncbi:MAG: DUF402 domain-containing protein [Acidobacteriota bacterium]|nr:DUF402 domain-containing protein [Acidobacteriota bacterium]MDH3529167.1 DUF402 domain-containing protein [Acidobacteriota bacterium]
MTNKTITINSRKYDGSIKRSWTAELLSTTGDELLFRGVFEDDVSHPNLGKILRGTISYEYYWLSRWFNVFRFHEPDGAFRNFYCNINMPPAFSNGILDFVDLDIDILFNKDGSLEVLDRDEFDHNSELYGYGRDIVERVRREVLLVEMMIATRQPPFDVTGDNQHS